MIFALLAIIVQQVVKLQYSAHLEPTRHLLVWLMLPTVLLVRLVIIALSTAQCLLLGSALPTFTALQARLILDKVCRVCAQLAHTALKVALRRSFVMQELTRTLLPKAHARHALPEVTAFITPPPLKIVLLAAIALKALDSPLSSLVLLVRSVTVPVWSMPVSALNVLPVTTAVPLASLLPLRSAKKDSSAAAAALLLLLMRVVRLAIRSVTSVRLA
jgi:hypothetical protein